MFSADEQQLNKFIRDLSTISNSTLPKVIRNTLNTAAFQVRKRAIKNLYADFQMRSKYVERGTIVKKSISSSNIDDLYSEVGNIRPFMKDQEEGNTVKRAAIPTLSARASRSYSKKIAKRFRLQNIKGTKKVFHSNKFKVKGYYQRKGKKILLIRRTEDTEIKLKSKQWLYRSSRPYITSTHMNRLFFKEGKRYFSKD